MYIFSAAVCKTSKKNLKRYLLFSEVLSFIEATPDIFFISFVFHITRMPRFSLNKCYPLNFRWIIRYTAKPALKVILCNRETRELQISFQTAKDLSGIDGIINGKPPIRVVSKGL
jgi:hypothetical protein